MKKWRFKCPKCESWKCCNKGDPMKEIDGESSGGSGGADVQKGLLVVADTPDMPKTESLTNKKVLDQKTHKKANKLLKLGSLTKKKAVDQKPNKKLKRSFLKFLILWEHL